MIDRQKIFDKSRYNYKRDCQELVDHVTSELCMRKNNTVDVFVYLNRCFPTAQCIAQVREQWRDLPRKMMFHDGFKLVITNFH